MKKLLSLFFCMAFMALNAQILHYTETKGYNHNTKAQSLAMFNDLAADSGYVVVNDDDGSEFNTLANLQQYDVVVFSNTSGSGGLDAGQRANFEAYIATGGSYLGIHAASDTYRHSLANGNNTGNWDWYAETVAGASVQESPNHTSSNHTDTMTIQFSHPIVDSIPSPWVKTEEYYYWENGYLAPGFTELLRVGQTGNKSYDAPRMMAHCRDLPGGGRAFYTALGHSASNFTSDSTFRQLIRDALIWTMNPSPIFLIEFPKPQIIEDYFDVSETDYTVSDMMGRIVYRGRGRVVIWPNDGIWIYKTNTRYWVHGTRL